MASVRILCDSGCDVPDDIRTRLNIGLVSLTIRFGTDEYVDRVTLSPAQFWAKCKESPTLPETAAPSPGAFRAAFDEAADGGADAVIVLTISADLSGTYQSALVAATEYSRIPVRVVDSRAVSMAQGLIAIELAEQAATGVGLNDLVAHAATMIPKVGVIAMLDTLEHLQKGGRVGGAKALIGQVLSIKPLLKLENGVVTEAGRQRTTSRALRHLADAAASHAPLSRLAIFHGESTQLDALTTLVATIDCAHPLVVADIGPTVGTHGGPGIIGLAWLEA